MVQLGSTSGGGLEQTQGTSNRQIQIPAQVQVSDVRGAQLEQGVATGQTTQVQLATDSHIAIAGNVRGANLGAGSAQVPVATRSQFIDEERPRDIQQQITSGALQTAQIGAAHIEAHRPARKSSVADPVAVAGDGQAVANIQLAIAQAGTRYAAVVQLGSTSGGGLEQTQGASNGQIQVTTQAQLSDVRGAQLEQGVAAGHTIQIQLTTDSYIAITGNVRSANLCAGSVQFPVVSGC